LNSPLPKERDNFAYKTRVLEIKNSRSSSAFCSIFFGIFAKFFNNMTKILVVEDISSTRALISSYLRKFGYTVIEASNGKEGLEKAIEQQPDLVITDILMPQMSGLELCRMLKKNESTKNVRIIICSSKDKEIDRVWGLRQGVDVYVTKPFTEEELIQTVKSLMF
jgi:two-component system, chemotaxis family, response regulator PixH